MILRECHLWIVRSILRVLLAYRMEARPTGRLEPTSGDRDDHKECTCKWHIARAKPPFDEPSWTAKELHAATRAFVFRSVTENLRKWIAETNSSSQLLMENLAKARTLNERVIKQLLDRTKYEECGDG